MEASWLSLIMIYGNSSCCGYDRDTSSTTEFENNLKKCGFTICYLWFVKLFICVKFYTKGERVLQLCYATMLQHNHRCITTLWFHFSSTPTGASPWSSSEPSRSWGGRWRLFWVRRWWWWRFIFWMRRRWKMRKMRWGYWLQWRQWHQLNAYFPSDVTFEPTHLLIKSPGGITWVYR